MKKQVWLEPHQVELCVAALKFLRNRLSEGTSLSTAAEGLAKCYTMHRIDEVLALFDTGTDVALAEKK